MEGALHGLQDPSFETSLARSNTYDSSVPGGEKEQKVMRTLHNCIAVRRCRLGV